MLAIDCAAIGKGLASPLDDDVIEQALQWVNALCRDYKRADECPRACRQRHVALGRRRGAERLLSR